MRKELFLIIPAVLLYVFAPDGFNWPFCALCCLVFLIGTFFVLKPEIKEGKYFSFNLVFFFSYFFTSFVFPLLVYGTQVDRDNIINKALDWNLLSHISALALLFIVAYIIGFTHRCKNIICNNNSFTYHRVPYLLYTVCLLAYLGIAVYGFLQSGHINMTTGKFLIDIYFTMLPICLYVNVNNNSLKYKHTLNNYIKSNFYLIGSSVLVVLTFIVLGDRMPAIKTVLTLFAVYFFFWNRIKIRHLILVGLCGLFLLFFVRETRSSDDNLASGKVSASTVQGAFDLENGALYLFADLFYINRELCLGYEYAQEHELYHPERIIIAPLSPVPFLPSIVSKLFFGMTPSEMDTGARLNDVLGTDYDIEGHLGNHPASDLLMSFGLIGMVLIAYFLGRGVGYIQKNMYSGFYMGVCYIVLMGWSLYLARSVVFALIRPLGYVFLFGYLIYRIPFFKKK